MFVQGLGFSSDVGYINDTLYFKEGVVSGFVTVPLNSLTILPFKTPVSRKSFGLLHSLDT